MKSEHTANNQLASTDHKTLALIKKGCCYMPIHRQVKAASIMAMNKPFAFRLAALNAMGTDKGRQWPQKGAILLR